MFIPMIADMFPVTEFINTLIGIIENINVLFNVIELHLAFGAAEAELHAWVSQTEKDLNEYIGLFFLGP